MVVLSQSPRIPQGIIRSIDQSGNCRAKYNCSQEVKKVLMARVLGSCYFLLAEYLILHLLWLGPNKSEGFFLLIHAILLKKSYLIYPETPVILLSPLNHHQLLYSMSTFHFPGRRVPPSFLGSVLGSGWSMGSPGILFWSYKSQLFGAGLVVTGFLFSVGICSLLESVWRCPWMQNCN